MLRTRFTLITLLLAACASEPRAPTPPTSLSPQPPPTALTAPVMQPTLASPPSATSAAPATDPMPVIAPQPAPVQMTPGRILSGCASTGTIEATLLPANILFLIDRSSSMNCNLPAVTSSADCEQKAVRADAKKPSKWEVVMAALRSTIEGLPEHASAGITYFSNDDTCGVQSKPNVDIRKLDAPQRTSLFASLDAVQPRGGTPIVGGLILAYKWFNPDQTPNQLHGNKFVVLLTDGDEGCARDATARLLQTEMPNSIKARITTFVIGVPGSEVNRSFLSQLAFAGGTASGPSCVHDARDPSVGDCHFDMTVQPDLAQALGKALNAISGRALQCEFAVPQPQAGQMLDYGAINVVYTASSNAPEELIAQDAGHPCESGANGWQYTADKSKIVLCGDACERVRRAASIRIVLGCQSVVLQ